MLPNINDRKCYVDPRICTILNCCNQNAISFVEDEEAPLGGRIEFDYNKCLGCGTCARVCCGNAVDLK